ncbi:hypothetical protein ANCCAN_11063, partial [Ancylostoma caninum]
MEVARKFVSSDLWIAMDSDEEPVPGSCIIENITEVEVVVTEAAEQQKDEIKSGEVVEEVESVTKVEATSMDPNSGEIVSDMQVCDTVVGTAEEEPNDVKEAKIEAESTTTIDDASTDEPAVLEATPTEPSVASSVFETPPTEVLTTITQPEAVPDKPPPASVIAEATPTDQSTAVDKPEATPTEQPSTSTEDAEKKSVIEAILAKLNDPEAKLNRRERRALQRELEAAQGIQRDFPTPSQNTSSDDASISHTSFDKEHNLIAEKWPGRGRSSYKRPATSSNEGESKALKVQKVQDTPPTIPMRRESIFKFDNVAMHPHDSVKDAFHCARMSYASTSFPINNFLKLCRFSPSGSHVATTSADNSARIFELNAEQKLSLVVKIPLGDPIYDAAWLFDGSDRQFLATTAK